MVGIGIGLNLRMDAVGGGAAPVSEVTQGSVTFSHPDAISWGADAVGDPYIVVPTGSDTLTVTPVGSTLGGEVINGMQKNPVQTNDQGYDEGMGSGVPYNAALNVGDSVSVTAGDILVKSIAQDPRPAQDRYGVTSELAVCHILSSALSSNQVLGGALGGSITSPDFETFAASLPSWSATGIDEIYTHAEIMAVLNVNFPIWAQFGNNTSWYQNGSPGQWGGDPDGTNYGEERGFYINSALQELVMDRRDQSEKVEMLKAMYREGKEWYEGFKAQGNIPNPNGGHFHFAFGEKAIYLALSGQTAALATLRTDYGINYKQAFRVTAQHYTDFTTPHSDLTKPMFSYIRTIDSVSSNQLIIPFIRVGETGDNTKWNGYLDNFRVRRISDGAEALITNFETWDGSAWTGDDLPANATTDCRITIDAQPDSPFIASDTVTLVPPFIPREGMADWAINGPSDINKFIPAPNQAYRLQVAWTSVVMGLKGMGIWHSEWDPVAEYVLGANTAGWPSNLSEYRNPHDRGTNFESRDQAFWDAHSSKVFTDTIPSFDLAVTNDGNEYTFTASNVAGSGTPTVAPVTLLLDGVDVSGSLTGSGPWVYTVPTESFNQLLRYEFEVSNATGSAFNGGDVTVPGASASGVTFTNLLATPYEDTTQGKTDHESAAFTPTGEPIIIMVGDVWDVTDSLITSITLGSSGRTFGTGTDISGMMEVEASQSRLHTRLYFVPNPGTSPITVQVETTHGSRSHSITVIEAAGAATTQTTPNTDSDSNGTTSATLNVTTQDSSGGVVYGVIAAYSATLTLSGVDAQVSGAIGSSAFHDHEYALGWEVAAVAGAQSADLSLGVAQNWCAAALEVRPA